MSLVQSELDRSILLNPDFLADSDFEWFRLFRARLFRARLFQFEQTAC